MDGYRRTMLYIIVHYYNCNVTTVTRGDRHGHLRRPWEWSCYFCVSWCSLCTRLSVIRSCPLPTAVSLGCPIRFFGPTVCVQWLSRDKPSEIAVDCKKLPRIQASGNRTTSITPCRKPTGEACIRRFVGPVSLKRAAYQRQSSFT